DLWYNQILHLFNKHFPLVYKAKAIPRNKPWFDRECNKAFSKKCRLFKKYKANPNEYNKVRFTEWNKHYKKLIKFTKNDYNSKLLDECDGDPKKTWTVINKLLGKNKRSNIIKLKKDNVIIEDNQILSNIFNENFNKVGDTFGATPINANDYLSYMTKKEISTFYFTDITHEEIKRNLLSLKLNKATNDEIPLKIFKSCTDELAISLATIYIYKSVEFVGMSGVGVQTVGPIILKLCKQV
ncbi:MAG: hypothetical protein AAFP87_21290, partial [Pseudomonadota bacterium]